ncbi:MAG: LON peptidase substrate-binding domain-containing protein [Planctomycetia bacterium]|nr:LON peptidase substrate-binding domain-containing protein [Planctomycetia bacterium]
MKSHPEFTADLTGFHGTAPIFPLPNVVLYPYTALPLRVFEPRYREMVTTALAEERLIAMALLKPGWEHNYEGRPAIHEMVCLGRITADERFDSGEFNIIVTGIHRAVVVEELQKDLLYRVGQLELYRDFYPVDPLVNREVRHHELMLNFRKLFPKSRADSLFSQVLEAGIPLGVACDLLASALRLNLADKQMLLEELDVDLRSDLLLQKIRERLPAESTAPERNRIYPPAFSRN